ncbi:unnamed protein product [Didymodactylos carnosus]|uniref:Uncharacterized protein n=1 Tax=Didymodactylos carnosus TaxID=1234261 RepID=A0A8S2JIR5_9BILA|nr:unnamed protein product [Didymodactylos carnosus]CAF3812000.1 unnamed protein product [Didymodactylos carnosus]
MNDSERHRKAQKEFSEEEKPLDGPASHFGGPGVREAETGGPIGQFGVPGSAEGELIKPSVSGSRQGELGGPHGKFGGPTHISDGRECECRDERCGEGKMSNDHRLVN